MAKTYTEIKRFDSKSSSAVHIVKLDETGALSCSCPSWKFAKAGQPRGCKHTNQVLADQMTAGPVPLAALGPTAPPAAEPVVSTGTSEAPKRQTLAEALADVRPTAEAEEPQAEPEPEAPEEAPAEADPVPAATSPDLPDIEAMLAEKADGPFDSDAHIFEPKLDGARCIVYVRDGAVRLLARSGAVHTDGFPELQDLHLQIHAQEAVLDAEVVCFDSDGNVDFAGIQSRMHSQKALAVKLAAQQHPATLMVFDVLRMNGVDLTSKGERVPLHERKRLLAELVEPNGSIRLVDYVEGDGALFFNACREAGMEGMMAKKRDGLYQPGKRSESWQKVKDILEDSFIVGGMTEGTGHREDTFGALLLGRPGRDGLEYVGSVGTGFGNDDLVAVLEAVVETGLVVQCPFAERPGASDPMNWVNPTIVVDVAYQELTPDGKLRFPSFQRLRPDMAAEDVGK